MNEETLFLAAMERTGAERIEFLEQACGENLELRRRVESLLESHEGSDPFLVQPILQQLLEISGLNGSQDSSAQLKSASSDGSIVPNVIPEAFRKVLQPSEAPDSLGRFSHFEILEVIGCGGFGTVLKACDDTLQRLVAIKVLAPEQTITQRGRQRFLREARAAAAVRHENVVVLFAVEESPIPHLVMELVTGPTLEQQIRRSTRFTVAEILRTGIQIAQGLSAAHERGLIHRDIKPSNILVEEGTGRVRITDFGLARAVDDASLTQANLIAGTPQYMSPEQAEGKRIDHRSDLFSLGSVLYALCTCQAPFRADSTLAVLRHVCDKEPVPISQTNESVPPFLVSIIQKLHAKQPEDRFQTAAEVASLLTQALEELETGGSILTKVPVLEPVHHKLSASDIKARRSGTTMLRAVIAACTVASVIVAWHLLHGTLQPNVAEVPQHVHLVDSAELAARPNAADKLDPAWISSDALAAAGNGDPRRAPSGLVAILGQSKFPHTFGPNPHSGIMDIAFSPDNKYLATSNAVCSLTTNDMTSWELKLWDFSSGQLLRSFDGLSDAVRALDFHPQGTKLAVACDDGTLKVLNVDDGQSLWDVAAHDGRARAVDWNDSGTQIVSGGDQSAAIWNADTGERLLVFEELAGTVLDVEFSSDGSRVLSTDGINTFIWQVADGKVLTRFPAGTGTMRSATFSHDNRTVVGVNIDSTVYVWNAETAKSVRELKGHTAGVLDVEISADGQYVATAGLDGTIRLWNFSDGTERHMFPGHLQHATSVAMTSDGKFLAGGDTRGRITVWNTETGTEVSDRHIGVVTSLAFSEAGNRLVSGGIDGTVRVWDLSTGRMERNISGQFDAVNDVALSPDRRTIAASGLRFIKVWNFSTAELVHSLDCHAEDITQIEYSPDGRVLASISRDGVLRCWNAEEGTLKSSIQSASVGNSLAWSPDGRFVAAGAGTEIHLYEMPGGRTAGIITGHSRPIKSLAFHPEGHSLVSSADPDDSGVRIWDIATLQEIQRLEGHIGGAQVCHWREDGDLIVTCGTTDGTIQLWDLTSTRPHRKVLPIASSGLSPLTGLALSPEGRFLAIASADGTIFIIKLADRNNVFRIND